MESIDRFAFRVSITKDIILNLELYSIPIDKVDRDFFTSAGYLCNNNADKVKRRLLKRLGTVPLLLEEKVIITNHSTKCSILRSMLDTTAQQYNILLDKHLLLKDDLEVTIEDIKRNGIVSYIRYDLPKELTTRLFNYRLTA